MRATASFGCQVWGVHFLTDTTAYNNALEQVHLAFLRYVTGAHRKVSAHVLRAEACSRAYVGHWAYQIVRFWNALAKHTTWLAHSAWKDNLCLMMQGCKNCWSHRFLTFANRIGLTTYDPNCGTTADLDHIMSLSFEEETALKCIASFEARVWQQLHPDPRTCTSTGATLCAYSNWMGRNAFEGRPVRGDGSGPVYHSHMRSLLPHAVYVCTSRYRMGSWKLQVNLHRRRTTGRLARHQRFCPLCLANGISAVEDELHTVFECPQFVEATI